MRGFVTVATGSKHYYEIAANLLLSYRYHSKDPLPFAIIADQENEYTALFDKVIVLKDPLRSYLNKFFMMSECPYAETIFLDSDCLAYGDLNQLWDMFDGATDFSSIGVTCDLHAEKGAWYNVEDLGEYGKGLEYKCSLHSGICYLRKGERLQKMYEDCMELYHNFDKMKFHFCPNNVDECVLGVAMARNGMKTIEEDISKMIYYPLCKKVKVNMWKGKVVCQARQRISYSAACSDFTKNGLLVHFATYRTWLASYQFEVETLKLLIEYNGDKKAIPFGKKLAYKFKFRYFAIWLKERWLAFKSFVFKMLKGKK